MQCSLPKLKLVGSFLRGWGQIWLGLVSVIVVWGLEIWSSQMEPSWIWDSAMVVWRFEI
jgi:hypothetical protein